MTIKAKKKIPRSMNYEIRPSPTSPPPLPGSYVFVRMMYFDLGTMAFGSVARKNAVHLSFAWKKNCFFLVGIKISCLITTENFCYR